MYCHSPTVAYRLAGTNPKTGRPYRPYKFFPFTTDEEFLSASSAVLPFGHERLIMPCGKCLLCTRAYRRMWALRCSHEMHGYDVGCFVTLTVSDEHIDTLFPRRWCYVVRDDDVAMDNPLKYRFESKWHSVTYEPFQRFMKRLRRHLEYKKIQLKKPLRFYMCGEYGDKTHRPHYHVILFGWMPDDLVPLIGKPGLFISKTLRDLWPYGFHTVGRVTFETISYVAGYVDKKLDAARMQWVDNDVSPEFVRMSRGSKKLGTGGIGREFWERFHDSDLYPVGANGELARPYALYHGRPVKMPQYYDRLLMLHDPEKYDIIRAARQVGAADLDVEPWLDECHRKHAVMLCKRKSRDPSIMADIDT